MGCSGRATDEHRTRGIGVEWGGCPWHQREKRKGCWDLWTTCDRNLHRFVLDESVRSFIRSFFSRISLTETHSFHWVKRAWEWRLEAKDVSPLYTQQTLLLWLFFFYPLCFIQPTSLFSGSPVILRTSLQREICWVEVEIEKCCSSNNIHVSLVQARHAFKNMSFT